MRYRYRYSVFAGIVWPGLLLAQSNIDAANKYAWCENVGWTNWRDADNAAEGVFVDTVGGFLFRFIWGENVGWINTGDGNGPYANTDNTDFGVNILGDDDLDGFAWGENIGWINFGWGAATDEADRARFDAVAGRFRGFAWGENVGWINLDDATHFVAVSGACLCQLHGDVFPVGPPTGNCIIDVDDILEVLRGFADGFAARPWTDIFPCSGNAVVDVDDILSVLRAFAGDYDCPHPCPP